ncbi:MAG: hypothetical protein U5J83_05805 [Bryobacterales bacterium]|nr:hypothetical protein [Bryobacterales bacterium]
MSGKVTGVRATPTADATDPKGPSIPKAGNSSSKLLLAYAVASFIAVASGCFIAAQVGLGVSLWLRNLAAWAIGAVLAVAISRISLEIVVRTAMVLTPLALLASLLGAGQQGVHRWISLGAFQLHPAFLLLPLATLAFAGAVGSGRLWAQSAMLVTATALYLQPDASQATAFAAAMLVALGGTQFRPMSAVATGLGVAGIAALSWFRPDPLAPVAEVESILSLAQTISPVLAVCCALFLLASAIVPWAVCRNANPAASAAARALSTYFLVCAAMPFVGAFPVPLLGMGVSPVLGFCLGVGALAASCKHAPGATEPPAAFVSRAATRTLAKKR